MEAKGESGRSRASRALTAVARWGLVFLFAWSAGGKLLWPREFSSLLLSLGMLPAFSIGPIAYGLPGVELALGLALARQWLPTPVLFSTLLLSAVFAGIHGFLFISGDVIPCGCAGVRLGFESGWAHATMAMICASMFGAACWLLFDVQRNVHHVATSSPQPSDQPT
jgi:hypothetical protein